MNSATTSEVLPETSFRSGLNVWPAGVGGGDGGGGVCGWKGRRKGEGRSRGGLSGHGWCVGGRRGGGRREEKLRSKAGGKTSVHFNGSTENIELLLQMVMSVNQLSLYGPVADIVAELPVGQRAPGKPVASAQLDEQETLTQPPLAELQADEERQGNLLQEYEQRFEKLSEYQKLSRLCSEAGLRLVEVGEFL